ncbi:MAG: F0F1 ATP synthase subunit B [bacterium]|nr:F0F1 ATP synthase subunit B [bacterium]
MLDFAPGLTIWSLITFFILFLALAKFAWPQILKAMEDREERIRTSIDDAEKAREEAEKIKAEYKDMIDNAKKESAEIIKQGADKAEKVREELVEKAREDAAGIIEKTKRELELERDKAVSEMKERAIDLSVAISAKIITSALDEEKQKELARQAIQEMESN